MGERQRLTETTRFTGRRPAILVDVHPEYGEEILGQVIQVDRHPHGQWTLLVHPIDEAGEWVGLPVPVRVFFDIDGRAVTIGDGSAIEFFYR